MKEKIGFLLGLFSFLLIWALPSGTLTPEAHRLAAITVLVVIFWIFEPIPIPVTALLGVGMVILFGVAPAAVVLSSFGDPIIFLFIGTFMLAKALKVHGVDKRIAYRLLSQRWVGGSTYRTLWAFGLVSWLLAMWMSITACVAMLFPVALAVGNTLSGSSGAKHDENRRQYTTSLLLILVYAAAAGAMATPIGTPPNLIGLGIIRQRLGISIGFLQWMSFALPLAIILLVSRYALLLSLFPPPVKSIPGQTAVMLDLYKKMGPRSPGQINGLIAFGVAVFLWILPGAVGLVVGNSHPIVQILTDRLPPGVVAMVAACLLFVLPIDWRKNKFTLTWEDAVQIDWGTILLFGGGIALGKLMLDTGLAAVIGKMLLGAASSPLAFVGVSVLVAVVMSEIASNTASANMVIPVMLSLVTGQKELGLAIALGTTFGASLGFMLPVATPGNAIVYGSGSIRMKDMIRAGLLVDISGGLIIWAYTVWIIPLIFKP